MTAQFLHIDTIARQSPKKATVRQWSVREVAAEAARNAAACRHVARPKPPVRVFGASPADLPSIVDERVAGATDSLGRKLRKDAKVMLAGVLSFPVPLDDVKRSHEAVERYRAWARASVTWLQREYGASLVCVVAHHDEKFPNLHFYAIPDFRAGQTMADLHPGMRAMAGVAGGKREKDAAYKAAMAELQKRFWSEVGRHFNHAQTSTSPRRRWSYRQWNEIKAYTNGLEAQLAETTKAYRCLMKWASAMAPTVPMVAPAARQREPTL